MHTLTNKIIEKGFTNTIFRASQLKRLVSGSPQSRYNLVNRAIKAKELVRFQRGLYMLDERFRDYTCHPFVLAQAFAPGSYISFETALAWHGWIPEAVFTTASAVSGRKFRQYEYDKKMNFSFHSLAIHRQYFLELVNR